MMHYHKIKYSPYDIAINRHKRFRQPAMFHKCRMLLKCRFVKFYFWAGYRKQPNVNQKNADRSKSKFQQAKIISSAFSIIKKGAVFYCSFFQYKR